MPSRIEEGHRQTEINVHCADVNRPARGQFGLRDNETRDKSANDGKIVVEVAELGGDVEARGPNQFDGSGQITRGDPGWTFPTYSNGAFCEARWLRLSLALVGPSSPSRFEPGLRIECHRAFDCRGTRLRHLK